MLEGEVQQMDIRNSVVWTGKIPEKFKNKFEQDKNDETKIDNCEENNELEIKGILISLNLIKFYKEKNIVNNQTENSDINQDYYHNIPSKNFL